MLDKPRARWTIEEARDRLDELVDAARAGEPQVVGREGALVVVLSEAEFERLLEARRAENRAFVAHLLAIPKGGPEDFEFERIQVEPRDVEF